MIKLKTDCSDCIHANVCHYKNNPKFAKDKLEKETFTSKISNDVSTWEVETERYHVNIEVSCPDFVKKNEPLIRYNVI